MYTQLRQALPRVVTHRSQVVKKKWDFCEYGSALRRRKACIKQRFRLRLKKTVSGLRCPSQYQNYILLLNLQSVAFVLCFLSRNLCKEWVAVFVSLLQSNSLCKPKANLRRKNQLYREARCFSPRSHRAVSLQAVPFLRDCKGRGFRRPVKRKTSEFIVI